VIGDREEKLIDGILHYLNEKGVYTQYSLEALASALTAERSMNRTMTAKLQAMRLPVSQILFIAKSLEDNFKSCR
jgi:hypothetical protein